MMPMEELLLGAAGLAILGALTSDSDAWNDHTGHRFTAEFHTLSEDAEEAAGMIADAVDNNAHALQQAIRIREGEMVAAVDRLRRELTETVHRIEAIRL